MNGVSLNFYSQSVFTKTPQSVSHQAASHRRCIYVAAIKNTKKQNKVNI